MEFRVIFAEDGVNLFGLAGRELQLVLQLLHEARTALAGEHVGIPKMRADAAESDTQREDQYNQADSLSRDVSSAHDVFRQSPSGLHRPWTEARKWARQKHRFAARARLMAPAPRQACCSS